MFRLSCMRRQSSLRSHADHAARDGCIHVMKSSCLHVEVLSLHCSRADTHCVDLDGMRIERQTYHVHRSTYISDVRSACRFDFVFPPKGSNVSIGDTAAAFVGAFGK